MESEVKIVAKTFKFEVVTPEKVFYSDDVEMVVFNREDGEMGIKANHMPMVVAIDVGILKILKDGEYKFAANSEGFIEITDSGVTAIVDAVEWPEDIDIERAKKSKKLAEDKLKEYNQNKEMETLLKLSIVRANNRIKVAQK